MNHKNCAICQQKITFLSVRIKNNQYLCKHCFGKYKTIYLYYPWQLNLDEANQYVAWRKEYPNKKQIFKCDCTFLNDAIKMDSQHGTIIDPLEIEIFTNDEIEAIVYDFTSFKHGTLKGELQLVTKIKGYCEIPYPFRIKQNRFESEERCINRVVDEIMKVVDVIGLYHRVYTKSDWKKINEQK